ncbi:FMN-dependent NADH-azoreductase [Herbiconiux daphne]|uniref:NAD(P)H-dependent oxidoreductase n=1 Tax=Herbiconiux daphne TaxID=2970914 RepID=A0ABT2H1D6_9MICO|nr:NAD(P)H-dependent oxidoreductase [Herbiconiux daphne]MCS5733758.1 NAD(P)H-dependent oxidoreductase [Herbiconiux daphne]
MTLFRLDASIMPGSSASSALGDIVEGEWLAATPGDTVVKRDLAADPIAATAWQEAVSAGFIPDDVRTPSQHAVTALARTLADEMLTADALVFNVPLYNFGVSQHFKLWFDLAYTVPEIGPGGTSALAGKPAVLNTTLGGNYSPGTPRHGWDHSTDWLRRVLGDVWQLDLHVVQRPFTLVGVNPALDSFADMAAELRVNAEQQAHEAGRAISEAARLVGASR